MNVVYVEPEPLGRTLISWALALTAIISGLVGIGKLLLGSLLFGFGLLALAALALAVTIQRIRRDCAGDADEGDFLESLEPHHSEDASVN